MRCWCGLDNQWSLSLYLRRLRGAGWGAGRGRWGGEEHAPGREANLRVLTLHDAPLYVGLEKLRLRFVLQLLLLEQGSQATV